MSDELTMLESICAALALIGLEVEGITSVNDPPKANLDTADLPAWYAFTGSADEDSEEMGDRLAVVTRQVRVQVAVMPTGQGTPEARETACRPLLEACKAALRSHPRLKKIAWVRRMRVTGDSGIVILPEWGSKFIGFEIRVRVETLEPVTFVQGE